MLKEVINSIKLARNLKQLKTEDEEQRKRAINRLFEVFSEEKGVFLKMAQVLGAKDRELVEFDEESLSSLNPISYEDYIASLMEEYETPLDEIFLEIDKKPITASLSQVHQARLIDGTLVAIKMKYPQIEKTLHEQLKLLKAAPALGQFTKIKQWGINIEEYVKYLSETLNDELNYRKEIETIKEMYTINQNREGVRIPNVHEKLCTDNVIIMDYLEGHSIKQCLNYDADTKRKLGYLILENFMRSLFIHGKIQTDPNDGNFKYLKNEIQMLDFGSYLNIDYQVKKAIFLLIDEMIRGVCDDPYSIFVEMGFDEDKLAHIEKRIPMLVAILAEPFKSDMTYDLKHWKLKERVNNILGEEKWWFRSSGPIDFFIVIKGFFQVLNHLELLDTPIVWQRAFHKIKLEFFDYVGWKYEKKVSRVQEFEAMAKNLVINVKKSGVQTVNVKMPITVITDLHTYMDESILKACSNRNINIDEIIRETVANGCLPRTLFQLDEGEKHYHISIE